MIGEFKLEIYAVILLAIFVLVVGIAFVIIGWKLLEIQEEENDLKDEQNLLLWEQNELLKQIFIIGDEEEGNFHGWDRVKDTTGSSQERREDVIE